VDCDHIVQRKVEISTRQKDHCLGYLHAEADSDLVVLSYYNDSHDPEFYRGRPSLGYGKCGVLNFGVIRPTARMLHYLSVCIAEPNARPKSASAFTDYAYAQNDGFSNILLVRSGTI